MRKGAWDRRSSWRDLLVHIRLSSFPRRADRRTSPSLAAWVGDKCLSALGAALAMSSIDDTRRDSWRGRKRRAVRRPSLNVDRDNGIRSFSADLGSTEETDEGDEHRPAHTSSSCSTSKRTISSFDGRRTTNFVRGRERRSRRFNWTPRSFSSLFGRNSLTM